MANFKEKVFIDANTLHEKSILLAARILESGFRPDFIIALWRGGSPVGIYVQEFLNYMGVDADHSPLKVNLYKEKYVGKKHKEVKIQALKQLVGRIVLNENIKQILILDDIFDSGQTCLTVKKCFRNYDVRIGVPYYKEENNTSGIQPDYYVEKVPGSSWVVFAHELMELKKGELCLKNSWISGLAEEGRRRMR